MNPRFRTPLHTVALFAVLLTPGCSPEEGDLSAIGVSLAGVAGEGADVGRGPATGPSALQPASGPWFVAAGPSSGLSHRNLSGPTAEEGKRYLRDTIGQGIAVIDLEGDGDLDLYFAQGRGSGADGGESRNLLYRNLGGRRFEECAEEFGLADRGYAFGVLAFDYDNDGDSDLLVTNLGTNSLYRNDGGRFTNVSQANPDLAGDAVNWSTGAAAADVDGDGDLDLYLCNYVLHDEEELDAKGLCRYMSECRVPCGPHGLQAQADVFLLNSGAPDYRFSAATLAAGFGEEASYGFQPVFSDVDDDGDVDLFVSNDSRPNWLFINDGTGRFTEQGMVAGVATGNSGQSEAGMGVAVGDLDGDLLPEISVTNFSTQANSLYANGTGPDKMVWFEEVGRPAGIANATFFNLSWGCAIADFDDDGWPDVFSANSHIYPQVDDCPPAEIVYLQRNQLFMQRPGPPLRFEEVGAFAGPAFASVGSHRASVAADLDDDGDLDLVVTRLDDVALLAWNESRGGGHWLKLSIQHAGEPPRLAVGARVVAEAGGRSWTGEVRVGSSFLSTEDPRVHLGLGEHESVERLTVIFPGGERVVLNDVATDRHLLIREGSSEPVVLSGGGK
jgi:hypothetical protein